MSKIVWDGHAFSTDSTFPRAYEASILNPLHHKFLATPLTHSSTAWYKEIEQNSTNC